MAYLAKFSFFGLIAVLYIIFAVFFKLIYYVDNAETLFTPAERKIYY